MFPIFNSSSKSNRTFYLPGRKYFASNRIYNDARRGVTMSVMKREREREEKYLIQEEQYFDILLHFFTKVLTVEHVCPLISLSFAASPIVCHTQSIAFSFCFLLYIETKANNDVIKKYNLTIPTTTM